MAQKEPTSVSYSKQSRPEVVIVSGRRLDDRGYYEFRPALLNAGALSQAAGSAYAELGSTKVMVGVYGPREFDRREAFSGRGRLKCDIRRTSFSSITRTNARQTDSDKESALVLQCALEASVQLEAFPKSVVDIYCLVLESGGSDMGLLVTAASLALADAGIPLFDLVAACNISRVGSQLLLDPTHNEAFREDGGWLLAMMPTQQKITYVIVTGEWTSSQFQQALELGKGGCSQLDASMRQTLKDSLS